MSASVTVSIVTNSLITGAKLFGFLTTGSPTLFAETVHSTTDAINQILLKVGELRAGGAMDNVDFGRLSSIGDEIRRHIAATMGKTIDHVYWQFPSAAESATATRA